MNRKIVVLGSSNTDMIVNVERVPRPGETLLGGAFSMAAGGKGANQAVAVARSGGEVSFICKLGRDLFGDQALAGFRKDGINVRYVLRDPASPSGVALIFVGRDGENSIGVASGANANLTPLEVNRFKDVISGSRILLMQLETPLSAVSSAAKIAARNGVTVILNPAPACPLPAELLKHISILTPNETEASLLSGMPVKDVRDAEKAARKIMARGVKTVIVTLGAKGALVVTREGAVRVPGFKVRAKDTTAAGDTFNGALATALSEAKPLMEAVRFAGGAAAISVTRPGAQPSVPFRPEIDAMLKRC